MRISRPLRDWSSWPIVPSTGSALYLRSHCVRLVCAEPYWAIIRSSLRDFVLQTAMTTPGWKGMHLVPNCVHVILPRISNPLRPGVPWGRAGTNVDRVGGGIAPAVLPHHTDVPFRL